VSDEREDLIRDLAWSGVRVYFDTLDKKVQAGEIDGDIAAFVLFKLLERTTKDVQP